MNRTMKSVFLVKAAESFLLLTLSWLLSLSLKHFSGFQKWKLQFSLLLLLWWFHASLLYYWSSWSQHVGTSASSPLEWLWWQSPHLQAASQTAGPVQRLLQSSAHAGASQTTLGGTNSHLVRGIPAAEAEPSQCELEVDPLWGQQDHIFCKRQRWILKSMNLTPPLRSCA